MAKEYDRMNVVPPRPARVMLDVEVKMWADIFQYVEIRGGDITLLSSVCGSCGFNVQEGAKVIAEVKRRRALKDPVENEATPVKTSLKPVNNHTHKKRRK